MGDKKKLVETIMAKSFQVCLKPVKKESFKSIQSTCYVQREKEKDDRFFLERNVSEKTVDEGASLKFWGEKKKRDVI